MIVCPCEVEVFSVTRHHKINPRLFLCSRFQGNPSLPYVWRLLAKNHEKKIQLLDQITKTSLHSAIIMQLYTIDRQNCFAFYN